MQTIRADAFAGPSVAGDELGLKCDANARSCESIDLIGTREAGVFDAMDASAAGDERSIGLGGDGLIHRVKRVVECGIADGVAGDGESERGAMANAIAEVLCVVDALAGGGRIVGVGSGQECGACTERTVGEEFDCAEAEPIVAEAGAEALCVERVGMFFHGHADDADGEFSESLAQAMEDTELLGRVEHGLYAGDAGADGGLHGSQECAFECLIIGRGDGAIEGRDGGLGVEAGFDVAGVSGIVGDESERGAVDDGGVSADATGQDGSIWKSAIQIIACGHASLAKFVLIPSEADDPVRRVAGRAA